MNITKVVQINNLEEVKSKKDRSIKPSKLSGLLFGIHKEIMDEDDGKDITKYICFTNNSFIYCDINERKHLEVSYKDLNDLSLSMSSRVSFRRIGFSFTYQIDIQFSYNNDEYWFEVYNPNYMLEAFDKLKQNNVSYQDKCNVEQLYKEHPNEYDRLKYLEAHFEAIAKEYSLDNPRK